MIIYKKPTKKICYLYAYLDKWDTLLKALFECSQSPNAALRESAFRIFASVPELIAGQHTDVLKNVFLTSLTDAESQDVSEEEEGRIRHIKGEKQEIFI